MELLIVLAIVLIVVLVISAPLRREWAPHRRGGDGTPNELERELAELEAARDAKYREIRDAELDHRTGKLSDPDYELVDRALRAEAVEILRRLDQTRERAAATIGER
jgi:hypothetical protein